VKTEPKEITPAPALPARWVKVRAEVIAKLGEPSLLDVELVDQMIVNLVEAETALRVAAQEPYTAGSRDQLTEHPGFRLAARCEATALAIATKLGVIGAVRASVEDEEDEKPQGVEDELAEIRARKAG
jgi:hypothetical protein